MPMLLCFLSANQYTFVTAIVMGMLPFFTGQHFFFLCCIYRKSRYVHAASNKGCRKQQYCDSLSSFFPFFIMPFLLSELWCSYTSCPHKYILLFSSLIQINNMNKSIMNFCLSFYTVTQLYCTKKVLFLQEFFMYRQMNRESWRMPLSHSVSSN